MKDNIKTILDFFKLVKGNTKWIICLFIGSIIGHLTDLFIPIFASNIVLFITNNNTSLTYWNIFYLAITYIIYNTFWYLNYVSYSYNFKDSYRNLREKITEKIFTYDIEFTNRISKATILNTVSDDVSDLSEMIDNICEIMVVFIKIIVMFLIFLKTNIIIGMLVILLEILYIKTFDYCNVKSTKYLMGQEKYRDKLTDNLSQVLNGLGEIKVFNIYDKMKKNFNIIADKWSQKYLNKRKYADIRESLLPFIIHSGKIVLYFILACLTLKGYYEVNLLILLISYYETIMEDTEDFMNYSRQIREWSVSVERIKIILNYTSSQNLEFGLNENDYINGLVEFKHVSFSYPSKNKGKIENVSFRAEQNQITAFVGHSGSGKTTITNLLLRKYKIDKGKILIDQENIYNYSKNIYSKNVVGVDQFPYLFSMSIRKNLSLINSNHHKQVEACKRVGIHDYIMKLPKGYNTILTENGSNFSGGQKQMLIIARALLSDAEIIIFDEVTSSLDPLHVEQIKEVLQDLKQDHTILLITHKKDVMKIADKIIVLNEGKIVGMGTHEELLKSNPFYIDIQEHSYSNSKK